MFNAPENLGLCLAALANSTLEQFELILVDDCSSDARAIQTARQWVARQSGARYQRMPENGGPGLARNAGAQLATGDVLVFVDSDVVVKPETLELFQRLFQQHAEAAAAFGSYDDAPAAPGLVTEYRNLLHHYTHQSGPALPTTFWAGCGAMRRDVFLRHAGFDPVYRRPCIEDIELGMRLSESGDPILLRPEIQCTHLKRWSFAEMVRVDVNCRAIPWTHLLIERETAPGNLNVSSSQKLCVVCAYLMILAPVLGAALAPELLGWRWLLTGLVAYLPIAWINRGLYAVFLRHRRGPSRLLFGPLSLALHLLYYLYSGFAFARAQWSFRVGGVRTGTRGA